MTISTMLDNELPIFLFICMATLMALATLAAAHILGPRRDNPVKLMPYESGMDPIKDARQRFDIRYYLLAIAFLAFDVELLFLYPWAVASGTVRHVITSEESTDVAVSMDAAFQERVERWREYRPVILVEIGIFLALLIAAYIYAWRRKVFQWT